VTPGGWDHRESLSEFVPTEGNEGSQGIVFEAENLTSALFVVSCEKRFRDSGGSHIQIARSPKKQGTRELPREFPFTSLPFLTVLTV
jgi:hypothetical protein